MPAVRQGAKVIQCPQFIHHHIFIGGLLREETPDTEIPAPVKHVAVRKQSVSSGAAGFLVIMLYALGHCRVNHETDIRPVYAHAKSHSCHDNINFLTDKTILVGMAGTIRKSGVIREILKTEG